MLGRTYLGRYETIRLLGEGGMGKAFLARDLQKSEPVVVKVMHDHIAKNPVFRERFRGEMALMGRLQHPNAVILLNASLDDPAGPCIVMEFLPGVSLDKLLQKNVRFNPPRLHRFVRQLCDVLQQAHDLGIVHRDLKPANLMVLDPDSPNEQIKVMDFGIAKLADPAERAAGPDTVKQVEYAVGTPGYMSPEQVRGDPVDHRSDIYSVGAILFQLLTGRLPFAGETMMEILMAQATDRPPSFASLGIGEMVSPAVEKAVGKALAIKPEDRPKNMKELFESYEGALLGSRRGHEAPAENEEAENASTPSESPVEETGQPDEAADATVEHMEAHISEGLVVPKIQAFVDEIGGTIVENAPGLIRMELRVHRAALRATKKKGFLSWLGLKPTYGLIEMELRIKKKIDVGNRFMLQITVSLRPADGGPLPTQNPEWLARCQIITNALKGYLGT